MRWPRRCCAAAAAPIAPPSVSAAMPLLAASPGGGHGNEGVACARCRWAGLARPLLWRAARGGAAVRIERQPLAAALASGGLAGGVRAIAQPAPAAATGAAGSLSATPCRRIGRGRSRLVPRPGYWTRRETACCCRCCREGWLQHLRSDSARAQIIARQIPFDSIVSADVGRAVKPSVG